jgi:hypothetical protein
MLLSGTSQSIVIDILDNVLKEHVLIVSFGIVQLIYVPLLTFISHIYVLIKELR